MIFVTVGSQKFQFDRLLQAVDQCIETGVINDEVFAQTGHSNYVPKKYDGCAFVGQESFSEKLSECDLLITHGGSGVIVSAAKQGKKIVAVPRARQYGEHVDDHQAQLVEEFENAGLVVACRDTSRLAEALNRASEFSFGMYKSSNDRFVADLCEYLKTFS